MISRLRRGSSFEPSRHRVGEKACGVRYGIIATAATVDEEDRKNR
jgi:hypothetical protein